MAEKSWFFNSAPGDPRVYQASDFAQYFGKVLSTGLLHINEVPGLQVKASGSDLRTFVEPGGAIMEGYAYENTDNVYLTHNLPEVSLDRIDRVVLRLDKKNANRHIKIFVREGVPATVPVPPALQRDNLVWELSLAQVRLRANTSTISSADVFDERLDRTVAGLVYSLISKPSMADIQTGGYAVVATTAGQTDFEIPLTSFDKVGDGLTVYVGGKKAEYSSYEVIYPRTVRFNVGVPNGTKVEFEVIRGVLKLDDSYVVNAGEVGIIDAGNYYESENVEGALQKIGGTLYAPKPTIYGVEINESNINPETAVTYIDDAALMNISSPSDWNNKWPFKQIKPCYIIPKENQFVSYLNPNNYAQKADGTPIDISIVTSGDVFIEIPQIWWKIEKRLNKLRIQIAPIQVDGDWQALAHKKGDIVLPNIYVGAYNAFEDGAGAYRSLTGKAMTSRPYTEVSTAISKAALNNCELSDYYVRQVLLQILVYIRYKNRNVKLILGANAKSTTGFGDTLGMYNSLGAPVVKFAGLENLAHASSGELLHKAKINTPTSGNSFVDIEGVGLFALNDRLPALSYFSLYTESNSLIGIIGTDGRGSSSTGYTLSHYNSGSGYPLTANTEFLSTTANNGGNFSTRICYKPNIGQLKGVPL